MIPVIITMTNMLFYVLYGMLFVRVILTWMPMIRNGSVVSFIFAFTEPMLLPVRKLMDRSPLGGPGMMLDFSPIITFFLLDFMRRFVVNLLSSIA